MSQPKLSELINHLMFDYTDCTGEELAVLSQPLPNKILRWLATHHPDNRTRKIFLRQTGVAIGNGSVVNANFVVSDDYQPLLHLGDRVAVSPNVTVICVSAPNNSILAQYPYVREHLVKSAPVVIDDDAILNCTPTKLLEAFPDFMSFLFLNFVLRTRTNADNHRFCNC
ncbi:MAG TPA: hypothetical protein DIT01_20225 [Lentisphaeria bacterium]|nr:hypothetical protein [Lentisphaeria bacterium]|tara:strand:+ start:4501 stop:5007 length:507 start_codon:yes stop_codon:yes gene_type:complete